MHNVVFIDTEVGITDSRIHDIGALGSDGSILHTGKIDELIVFLRHAHFVCGHNIIHHDLKYLAPALEGRVSLLPIDTLYLSPLLFPRHPYHALLKDDKLQTDELNNPVNDCRKAQQLFTDEVDAFHHLHPRLQRIYYHLLKDIPEFKHFFEYLDYSPSLIAGGRLLDIFRHRDADIRDYFDGRICANADIDSMIRQYPVELAYALALTDAGDSLSIIPPWTLRHYPQIYNIITLLRNRPCASGCPYCDAHLNPVRALRKYFGYEAFRTYKGEPLQERAVDAAIHGKSMLVVFPTGGGKSITFQIPALLAGENEHGLTVVISPLQSLMKDQVDNLAEAGITSAVTVNGLLSPIERADAFRRIADGSASLLYISPEMLRSRTVEKMLMSRNVVRFVIDEAHCFSAWGQDFRIDYLYIADFINKLQRTKANGNTIAVSCFTATAKQKVISDICTYFNDKLHLSLEIFASGAARDNLTYSVLYRETDEEKYTELRNLIEQKNCPTIVYVSRTRRTFQLAQRLTNDGFPARPFNGKMEANEKIDNQEAFIRNEFNIIVATSAFGMGVDKKDVRLVVHYDISDSLENYIQESGRAGRDTSLKAECYVLYNETDLDKHFILLNQNKLSISDIQQVWQGIKRMTGNRRRICCSPLEVARMAGWDSSLPDIETRVKTAVAALENAGYIRRGNNMPRIYATGITARNLDEAYSRIDASPLLTDDKMRQNARRIIKSLISSRSIAKAGNDDAESRVDYLADILGIPKAEVITLVDIMREDGLLADSMDMSAYITRDDTQRRTFQLLERFTRLERYLLSRIEEDSVNEFNLKQLNAEAAEAGITHTSLKDIRTLLYFLTTKQYIRKEEYRGTASIKLVALISHDDMLSRFDTRIGICQFIIEELYNISRSQPVSDSHHPDESLVPFSLVGLYNKYRKSVLTSGVTQTDVQDALLYLSRIGALRLEGGFLVLYNGMEINRLEMNNRISYKREDYSSLNEYYIQKMQQIHIVGEFANIMVRDYNAALQFVNDYFQMDYRKFISSYFKGSRADRLNHNMTHQRYQQLFGSLSAQQKRIIDDDDSRHIVVVAGPGSGKTRVLVHKLAAMLTLEDVKHEQLLMVTFSRAAATEFKLRLKALIGNAANFVEIKTFHSYCFDIMGRIGSLDESGNVVSQAVRMIREKEVEPERISKSVLVVDEAQDMDQDEFNLITALIDANDGMRVIAVGDDDQNIYQFRGSDSKYMRALVNDYDARMYELVDNYRSEQNIVRFSNLFAHQLKGRLKNKDIVSVSDQQGQVMLVEHCSKNIELPLIRDFMSKKRSGSTCFMTSTNDEAFRLLGLLLRNGIHARLIQSTDGFALSNLAEVRYFLKKLVAAGTQSSTAAQLSPIIADSEWEEAKDRLQREYSDSSCLYNCMSMLSAFEETNARKYRSDLEEFIRESNFEDFYTENVGSVYVSTIHKTKGREFDNVFILLNNVQVQHDEAIRKLYVGMTRARSQLHIHYFQTPIMGLMQAPYLDRYTDTRIYSEPEEIALQLTHKDVFLDFFRDIKREILQLHSGLSLVVDDHCLSATLHGRNVPVVRFSKKLIAELNNMEKKGYKIYRAEVRFVVAWRPEESTDEIAVLLPNIYLRHI